MDMFSALLGPVSKDDELKALADTLRKRKRAADFYSLSTIKPLQAMGQSAGQETVAAAERQGVLREALARRQQQEEQNNLDRAQRAEESAANNALRQAMLARDTAYQNAMLDMRQDANDLRQEQAQARAEQARQKEAEKQAKIEAANRVNETRLIIVSEAADNADALISGATTGIPGKIMSGIPGSDRKSLEGYLDTLKANLSFERLQEMRDNSVTGGALGNVSNVELALLGSTVASLDPDQDPDVLRSNLAKVKDMSRTFFSPESDAGTTEAVVVDTPVVVEDDLEQQAQAAIAAGADPEAVYKRLEEMRSGQ